MPLPSQGQVHAVDFPLSNLSVAVVQDEQLYGASRRMFPVVNVEKQTNKYYVWTQDDFFRSDAAKRSGASESAGSGLRLSTDSYSCDQWSSHFDIDGPTRGNADVGIDLERAAVMKVTRDILIREDLDWMAKFFVTGVWNASGGPVNGAWELTNSTPIEDLRARFYTIAQNTGFLANQLGLGANVWKRLQDHPDLLDRIKYTQRAVVTQDLLASVLGISGVQVFFGVQNTAVEGATASYSFDASNHALLCYAAPAASLFSASAGLTFNWTGMAQAAAFPITISRIDLPERNFTQRIEANASFGNKVVAKTLGELVLNAVTN